MCGRVDIHTPPAELARLLEAALAPGVDPDGRPSWNVAPSRGIPVVLEEPASSGIEVGSPKTVSSDSCVQDRTAESGNLEVAREELRRRLDMYRWGLLPHWAKDTRVGYKMINAKAETLTKSPAYRGPFREHRCLVVVDGFFEWQALDETQSKNKVPFYFRRADGQPITFAGLFEIWWDKSRSKEPDPETLLRTCTIITTEAGPDMIEVHNRMPVIIERRYVGEWLDSDRHDTDDLLAYLGPSPAGTLLKYAISKEVNSPRNDGPQVIEPLAVPGD
jgi:putative SOS response-associated peptidase YedK